jgi:DNA invertase Pin-like site-specific DNA recombinase
MKIVIYRRVSTKGQGDSGLGLEAQERDIALFLESHAGEHEVIGEFFDIESGANNNREGLAQAVALCQAKGAALLVAKLDRLSRRVSYIAAMMEAIEVRVACMPNADNFQLHIYAALAQQERDFISQRTKAALREAKARGVKLGGLRDKTGARNKAKRVQADMRAERYRALLAPMVESGMSLRAMADALSGATGESFSAVKVMRMRDRLGMKAAVTA